MNRKIDKFIFETGFLIIIKMILIMIISIIILLGVCFYIKFNPPNKSLHESEINQLHIRHQEFLKRCLIMNDQFKYLEEEKEKTEWTLNLFEDWIKEQKNFDKYPKRRKQNVFK